MRILRWGAAGAAMAVALLASGCRDDGENPKVYCDYVRGSVTFTHNQAGNGDAQSPHYSADGRLSTFAFVGTELQQTFSFRDKAPSAVTFDDLPSAVGAFVTIVPGPSDSVTLNTYLDGVLQESASGASLVPVDTDGRTAAEQYLGFMANKAFDEVELTVATGGGSEYSIYEFCGDARFFD